MLNTMKNKTVLCIDWSNIMFRSLFINQLYGKSTRYDNIEDCKSFTYKFASDICSIINIFDPANVILLTDAQHAWRKDILPGEDGYKSNRERGGDINWDNIFKCSDDLKDIFKEHGVHVATIEHAEADDMAALCKEAIFEKFHDMNMIVVSADADLRQLLDYNSLTNQYCIVYNTIAKGKTGKRFMYASPECVNWINTDEPVDIFFSNLDDNKQYIKNILNANSKLELASENPNDVVLHKIFCGDDGDCVPSFYSWVHNGKFVRITPSKEKKVRETLGIKTIQDLLDSTSELKPLFESICKKEINDINIEQRLNRQRILVELNSNLFPLHIKEYKAEIEKMLLDSQEGRYNGIKAADILQGTKYEGADKKKALVADVFKDINKYGLTQMPMF